jgi:hypothetical protein
LPKAFVQSAEKRMIQEKQRAGLVLIFKSSREKPERRRVFALGVVKKNFTISRQIAMSV